MCLSLFHQTWLRADSISWYIPYILIDTFLLKYSWSVVTADADSIWFMFRQLSYSVFIIYSSFHGTEMYKYLFMRRPDICKEACFWLIIFLFVLMIDRKLCVTYCVYCHDNMQWNSQQHGNWQNQIKLPCAAMWLIMCWGSRRVVPNRV